MADRHFKEKLQPGNGRVERDRRDALINKMQLKVPQLLGGRGLGRAAQILGQLPYRTDIRFPRPEFEFAHSHVLDHA